MISFDASTSCPLSGDSECFCPAAARLDCPSSAARKSALAAALARPRTTWLRATGLEHQAILQVLDTAYNHKISLPEAVEECRKACRASIRNFRTLARKARAADRGRMAAFYDKRAEEACRDSQRIRRMQRRFASWRLATV